MTNFIKKITQRQPPAPPHAYLYKINIDDGSFICTKSNTYGLLLYKNNLIRKRMTVAHYVKHIDLYKDWYLSDKPHNVKILRKFNVEVIKDPNIVDTFSNDLLCKRLKYVEDVVVGDMLVGPDGTPRYVTKTHSDEDDMYEIIDENGSTHVVNSEHVLHLIDITTLEQFDMQVNVYMHTNNEFKEKTRIIKIVDNSIEKKLTKGVK